ncbi:MAG: dienelactone hydrolase family protein, partial [Candidatus Bathyarchaeota archaeon]|nr:dienelactone hydrolase family protein [Candidatus Bathyarchaeota archaeon]
TRFGFISLTIDLAGHGDSGGRINGMDASLGAVAAFDYLASLPEVDQTRLGVVGHSLGAGAVREVAAKRKVSATIFIGGATGISGEPNLTANWPPNMLIAVGEEDVLVDLTNLKTTLITVFSTQDSIRGGESYGSFDKKTARMLFSTPTIHLLEPLDTNISAQTLKWLQSSFYPNMEILKLIKSPLYPLREMAIGIALTCLIASTIPFAAFFEGLLPGSLGEQTKIRNRFLRERNALLGWGLLGLLLYAPAMLGGSMIAFPPLIFGSGMAWWLLTSGIAGIIIIYLLGKKQPNGSFELVDTIRESFKLRDVILSIVTIGYLYLFIYVSQLAFGEKLRLIVPILPVLNNLRIPIFPLYFPFFLVYFTVEGFYLHVYRGRQYAGNAIDNLIRTGSLKLAPYLLLLAIQYGIMFATGNRLIPGFAGFFIEFIWAIVPMFIFSTAISWGMYRFTGRIGAGAILNSLIFAWICAGLFPFGGLM